MVFKNSKNMNSHKKLFLLGALLVLGVAINAQKQTRQEYIDKYKDIAIEEMKRAGIPASVTLAQGLLESDNGNSTLAVKANNHFGIKCHKSWSGETFIHSDDRPNECFRKYKNAEQSFRDHSDFLLQHSRYAFLFEIDPTDYKKWCKGLKDAGYATNKHYDNMLIKIIDDNKLHQFDNPDYKPKVSPLIAQKGQPKIFSDDDAEIDPFGGNIKQNNRVDYIIAREGDTFESIAERQGLMPWQLYKYNEVTQGVQPRQGDIVYLQPKRRKADVHDKTHIVKPGETMYGISQKYAIKLKHLYRINDMRFGYQPEIGNKISLRKKVKRLN
jgi:hypothetical protein